MRTAQAGFKQGRAGESAADLLARVGPTILVHVGLKSMAPRGEPPDLPLKDVHALIDTGAGADGIDDDLAQQLSLPVTEEGWISGVGGRHRAAICTARIYVPALDRLLFQRFTGMRLSEGEQAHRVILGRGFLRRYRLIYGGLTAGVEIVED